MTDESVTSETNKETEPITEDMTNSEQSPPVSAELPSDAGSLKNKRPNINSIKLVGELRINAAISMLFSDILSQELNALLTAPDTVTMVQNHLKGRPLEQMTQNEIQPLLTQMPEEIAEVIKEAAFTSGAMTKRLGSLMEIKVGERFIFRASGLMGELEMRDGRVTQIRRLLKR